MGYRVKGMLKLPDGTPGTNCEIEFTSRKNFTPMLTGMGVSILTDSTGAYDVTLEYGAYAVILRTGNTYPSAIGQLTVGPDTVAGQDLPTLLEQSGWQPATPEYIKQITEWLDRAESAAVNSEASAVKASTDGAAQAALAKSQADRAKSEADRASKISGLETVADAIGLAALPLPDVWAPLSDSLRLITGYGRDVLVGSDVVARMVNFSRSTTATYIDKSGVLRTAAINEPRFEKDGLLIEGQSTNLITTSAALATSTVTVAAGSYTLSFYGTGSVTLSGAATGVLTGTAADKRVSLTVTTVAGALTLTVTGACSNAQLEALPFATSYIPTDGAAATRAPDKCSIPQWGNLPDVSGSDYFIALTCKLYPQANLAYRFLFRTGDISAVAAGMAFGNSLSNTSMRMYTGLSDTGYVTQPIKYGQQTTYGSGLNNKRAVSLGPAGVNRSTVDFTPTEHSKDDFLNGKLGIGSVTYQGNYMYGHIRNFRIWHRALTDDQLKAIV